MQIIPQTKPQNQTKSMLGAALEIGGQLVTSRQDIPGWLETLGGCFCRVTAWNSPDLSPGKKPVGLAWQDKPLTWAQVEPHVKAGGNIGLICGQHSAGIIIIDVDKYLPEFLAEYPQYKTYPRIERGHAGKAKFIIRLPAGQLIEGHKYKEPGETSPFFEVLSTGNQGVIPPSKHTEGGQYVCINAGGLIPTVQLAQLQADVLAWAELMQCPAPTGQPQAAPDRSANDNGSGPGLREAVKAYWPPLKVFERFGMAANGAKHEGEYTRVLGNGGLFCNDNELTWNRPGDGKGAGGDSFDAWYFCETGKYKLPRAEFRKTLVAMATAAGITIPTAPRQAGKTSQAQTGSEPQPLADGSLLAKCLERGETGDSELFSALFSDRVKFDWLENKFYTWQGSCWAPEAPGEVVRLVHSDLAIRYLDKSAELLRAGDEKAKPYLRRAGGLLALSRINNVLTLAQSQQAIGLTGKEWDIAPMILTVKNGLIDLQAGTFRPTTPADYVRTFAPVEWRGLNEPAPIWEKTLLEIFGGDPDLVSFARRLFGYSITGATKEQVLPILYGEGANGKSTILEVLAAVLGADFGGPTSADAIMDTRHSDGNAASPFVYAMRGKRLVWANESKEGQKLNTGLVKQLTGDSLITARPLFGNPVTFQQTHKIMLITNHLPRIPDSDDYAIWRRVLRIPFDVRFVEKPTLANERKINKDLPELLKKEYPGILAWLVRGCLEWQALGLAAPAAVVAATEKYREDEDLIGQFIDEKMLIQAGIEAKASDIYKEYTGWAEQYGYNPMSMKALGTRLQKKFGQPTRKMAGMFYQGVGLLTNKTM